MTLILIGSLWWGANDRQIIAPELVGASGIAGDIRKLDEFHAEVIDKNRKFGETLSLVALILAATAAAATVLRAPQMLIVAVGGLGAIVYGAIQLYSPQSIVDTLSKARSKLACVETVVRALEALPELSDDNVKNMLIDLEGQPAALQKSTARAEVFLQRLIDIKDSMAEARTVALKKIDEVLITPTMTFAGPLNALRSLRSDLSDLNSEVATLSSGDRAKFPQDLIDGLTSSVHRIQVSEAALELPSKLEKQLLDDVKAYHVQLADTAVALLSRDEIVAANNLRQETLTVSGKLESWPANVAQTNAMVYRAVVQIEDEVQRGQAKKVMLSSVEIAAIAAPITEPVYSVSASASISSPDYAATTEPELIRADDPVYLSRLIDKTKHALNDVNSVLDQLNAELNAAELEVARIRPVVDIEARVLQGSRKLLELSTTDLTSTIESLKNIREQTDKDVDKARQIVGSTDFVQLKAQITSCASGGFSSQ